MKCIFCLEEITSENRSDEHIFPKSLGARWETDKVCSDCNSDIGSRIDSKLSDHPRIKLIRIKLGLETTHGELPKLAWKGTLSDDEEVEIEFQHDEKSNFIGFRVFPKTSVKPNGVKNKVKVTGDPENRSAFYEAVRKKLKRKYNLTLSDSEIDARTMLKKSERPVGFDTETDVFNCKRALLKIAYEMANEFLGTEYLNDGTGSLIRDVINEKTGKPNLNRFILFEDLRLLKHNQLINMDEPLGPEHFHSATLSKKCNQIVCDVSIFSEIKSSIVVSEYPENYPEFNSVQVFVDPMKKIHDIKVRT